MLGELLCTYDLVLMTDAIEGLRNVFKERKKAFESKGFKVNLGKTKVMVSVGITVDGMHRCRIDPCEVCSLILKANSVFFVQ